MISKPREGKEGVIEKMEVYSENITTFVIYNEIASILEEFDFPCCIVKGEPLSKQAYCDFSIRKSADVDFIMSKKKIQLIH